MDETCRLRRGEGYGACIDEKQEKAKVSCAHLGEHICPQCGQFGAFTQGLLRGQNSPTGVGSANNHAVSRKTAGSHTKLEGN